MGPDFDVIEFCKKLRNSKQPPYQCPVVECGKIYKSLCGLQYHLVNFDHSAPPPLNPHPTPGRKKGRSSHHSRQPSKTSDLLSSPTREGLTYAEAQKMVEFDFEGRGSRVSIFEPLPVMSTQEFEAKFENSIVQTAGQAVIDGRPPMSEERAKLPEPNFTVLDSYNISDAPPRPNAYVRFIERSAEELDVEVEYDMDEEDAAWLALINQRRAAAGLTDVPVDTFELLMDRLEKESYFQMQSCGQTGEAPAVIDDDAVCCICMDGECQNSNVILFCDMCNLAVHQDCYGVPYIPEGQWLCRRCLQSPSRAVDCVLCPNNGGAFKQTDRGHWAHVVCALWIPEVRFANTVFLEPIDSIETIPPARWKLTCYICKQRGVGACIQCHKTNCYAAFHVTCAQQAGLFMKMDTVKDPHSAAGMEAGPMLVQKTAFCDSHTPPDATPRPPPASKKEKISPNSSLNMEDSRQKMKKARRILAKKRSTVPVISIPTIPPDRIQEIASLVTLPKKSQLIQRLIAYWTLKRQYLNGVPLLRRLQSSHLSRRDDPRPNNEVGTDINELYRQLKYWQCLRQDLERARLLCELVRKREKLKKELVKSKEAVLMLQLQPLEFSLLRLLELIQARDTGDIFSEPVDQTEVLDYSDVVKQPMDLSTMKTKIENCQYPSVDAFEADFNLMISNCMAYNSKETIFYRAAVRMRDQGGALIRQARRDLDHALNLDGGGLKGAAKPAPPPPPTPARPTERTTQSEDNLAVEIDREFSAVTSREEGMSTAERLSKLLELLDHSQSLRHGLARAKRVRLVKAEIAKVRRKIAQAAATSESDSEREESSDDGRSATRPRRQAVAKQQAAESGGGNTATPETKPARARKKKAAEALRVPTPPPVQPVCESPVSLAEISPAAPITPAKLVVGETNTPLLQVSPSGVNRRTAVLFTRKAQAVKKSDPPPSPSPVAPPATGTSRRRVGRPRKNLDSALSQVVEPPPVPPPESLAVGPLSIGESTVMPDPVLPCTESFRVYRSGGEIPAETDDETQSDSCCSSCSSTDGSTGGAGTSESSSLDLQQRTSAPESSTEEGEAAPGGPSSPPEPLDLIWAKCRGYPWYPALMIDPKMPRSGFLHNGVPIPSPPLDVLALAANYTETVYLVLFFDTKRTWQWLPRNKLEPLGISSEVDQSKLTESRKPTDRKAVRKAYQEALQHRCQVTGGTKRGRSSSTAAAGDAPPLAEN